MDGPRTLVAAAAAAVSALPGADAAPVPLQQQQTLGQVLAQAGQTSSLSISFDVRALLESQGLAPGDILGGAVTVSGNSIDRFTTTSIAGQYSYAGIERTRQVAYPYSYTAYQTVTGYRSVEVAYTWSYKCGLFDWATCYATSTRTENQPYQYTVPYTAYGTAYKDVSDFRYERDTERRYTDLADALRVSAGTSVREASTSTSTSSEAFGPYEFDRVYRGSEDEPWLYLYSRTRNVYVRASGPLSVTLALDPAALADLMQDGSLAISAMVPMGSVSLDSAQLNFTAQSSPPPVPEPASVALTASGLAALLLLRRRRQGA